MLTILLVEIKRALSGFQIILKCKNSNYTAYCGAFNRPEKKNAYYFASLLSFFSDDWILLVVVLRFPFVF